MHDTSCKKSLHRHRLPPHVIGTLLVTNNSAKLQQKILGALTSRRTLDRMEEVPVQYCTDVWA
jgi:hypothetical protein